MKKITKKIKSANKIWREKGWRGINNHLKKLKRERQAKKDYQIWIRDFDTPDDTDRANIKKRIADFSRKPLISVVMPVYNVEEKWLRLCIESVFKQIYENWEFCIADDASTKPHIRRVLEEYAAQDSRLKIVFREKNGHISAASNSALELAMGEFCALLDHDDELAEHALFWLVNEINNFPEAQMFYSDEDMIDAAGNRYDAKFKPDFSLDLFYSLNLITHLSAYETATLRKIGGFRIGLEGSQDYDLALRVVEEIGEKRIRHIPRILYHWRAIEGSVALAADQKSYAHEKARQAITEHLKRKGIEAEVIEGYGNLHRVFYDLPAELPKISLILVTSDTNKHNVETLQSLFTKTAYKNFEVLLGTPFTETMLARMKASEIDTLKSDKRLKLILFRDPEKNLADTFNKIAETATGEILIFLDGTLEVLSEDWLHELVRFALQKEIGAVGGKILNPDETIAHAGYIFGIKGSFGTAHKGFGREEIGNLMRLQVSGNFSSVSAACLAIRRELFQRYNGFDEETFSGAFADIDLCLRLREFGYRIVFTPYAEFIRRSKPEKSRTAFANEFVRDLYPKVSDMEILRKKHKKYIEKDEFYNPNLTIEKEDFSPGILPF